MLAPTVLAACVVTTPAPIVVGGAGAMEYGVNRPGSDFQNFELAQADPGQCQAACAREPQCLSFTYVNAGIQGPNPRCWLKNAIPAAVNDGCCTSGVVRTQPDYAAAQPAAPVAAAPPAAGLEPGIDRPGYDFQNFDLPQADPGQCQAACASNPGCHAFTYVTPGVQGPNPRCWLKNSVPQAVPSACCTSGVVRP